MKYFNKIILFALIGIGIGTTMHYIFCSVLGYDFYPVIPSFAGNFNSLTLAVGSQLLVFSALGIIQGLAGNILKGDERPVLKQIIIHYVVIALPLIFAGYYLHWFKSSFMSLIFSLVIITVVYIFVFLLIYISIKNEIGKINNKLSKSNHINK